MSGLRRAISIIADLSAYYWSLFVVSTILGSFGFGEALLGFAFFLAFKFSHALKLPVLKLAVRSGEIKVSEAVEWDGGIAVVRVKVRGEGWVEISLSGTTLVFVLTLVATLARLNPFRLSIEKLPMLLLIAALSIFFYKASAFRIKSVGVAVPVATSVLYATAVSLTTWLLFKDASATILSVLLNFISILIGCDLLAIKWAAISNTKTFIIGGLGIYDALVFVPATSYFITSLAALLP